MASDVAVFLSSSVAGPAIPVPRDNAVINFFIEDFGGPPGMAQVGGNTVIIDVITENTGPDVLDIRRIISVQMGDSSKQDVFHAEANDGAHSLFGVALQVNALVARGSVFAGYDIKQFELPLLKRFLGLTIPGYRVVDLKDLKGVVALQSKATGPILRLDDVCREYKVSLEYKLAIEQKAEAIKKNAETVAKADAAAQHLAASKGWTPEFARQYALDSISSGQAVLESYNEFVEKKGSRDTIFYRYAAGQVTCEHSLLVALSK